MSALDLLGFGFPLTGTIVLGVLVWLFRGALPVSPDDGIGGGGGGGSDRTPPGPRAAVVAARRRRIARTARRAP